MACKLLRRNTGHNQIIHRYVLITVTGHNSMRVISVITNNWAYLIIGSSSLLPGMVLFVDLMFIRMIPNRLSPLHLASSKGSSSYNDRPLPHNQSYAHSTNILEPVAFNKFINIGFWVNFCCMPGSQMILALSRQALWSKLAISLDRRWHFKAVSHFRIFEQCDHH